MHGEQFFDHFLGSMHSLIMKSPGTKNMIVFSENTAVFNSNSLQKIIQYERTHKTDRAYNPKQYNLLNNF